MAYKRTVDKAVEVQLPITPMLDMAFQLMFFFLATFNPSSVKEGQMELSLPSKTEAAAKDQNQVQLQKESVKEEVDVPSNVTIEIRGYRDAINRGEISYLTVKMEAVGEEEVKGRGNDPKEQRKNRDEQLRDKLASYKPPADAKEKDGKPKVPAVRVAAESNIRWENVMQIMDVCYKAGFQVSFVKPPDLGSAAP